ncbi:hypothetical protein AK812_SmicGene26784 [Symbiodinium microadriaticum]|uniref:Uncharacterized protein n=1 Tax=Symbiodinium microadriaticum TaxID=2951 RepID=A0A1Q9D8R1_SYMMI|nr:hypothetical protein AK812_SmicGene26784 [Symbiodinium microadriaticum]
MEDSKHSAPLGGQGERPSCDVFTKGMCPTFQACPMSGQGAYGIWAEQFHQAGAALAALRRRAKSPGSTACVGDGGCATSPEQLPEAQLPEQPRLRSPAALPGVAQGNFKALGIFPRPEQLAFRLRAAEVLQPQMDVGAALGIAGEDRTERFSPPQAARLRNTVREEVQTCCRSVGQDFDASQISDRNQLDKSGPSAFLAWEWGRQEWTAFLVGAGQPRARLGWLPMPGKAGIYLVFSGASLAMQRPRETAQAALCELHIMDMRQLAVDENFIGLQGACQVSNSTNNDSMMEVTQRQRRGSPAHGLTQTPPCSENGQTRIGCPSHQCIFDRHAEVARFFWVGSAWNLQCRLPQTAHGLTQTPPCSENGQTRMGCPSHQCIFDSKAKEIHAWGTLLRRDTARKDTATHQKQEEARTDMAPVDHSGSAKLERSRSGRNKNSLVRGLGQEIKGPMVPTKTMLLWKWSVDLTNMGLLFKDVRGDMALRCPWNRQQGLMAKKICGKRGLAWKRSLSDIAQLGGALHILAPSSPRCWPEFACPITPATFQVQHSLPKLQRKHLGG